MLRQVAWLALAPCLVMFAGAAVVRAQAADVLGANVELGAGYDSNPILALDPNARRDATSGLDGPGPGVVSSVLGQAYASSGRAPWLGVALTTDARLYHSADVRHDTLLSLIAGTRGSRTQLSVSLSGGRYDASFGADNAWYGTVSPTARWQLSSPLSLGLEGHVGARRYAGGAQTNLDFGGALDLQLRKETWLAAFGVDLARRESTEATAARAQLTPFVSVEVALDAWSVSLRYAAFARWFDGGDQDGSEHTLELGARYRLGKLLSLSTRLGAGVARGQADALSYDRLYAMAGLVFTLGTESSARVVRPDRSQQGAAEVAANMTRFRVCMPGARDVAVVGTFNGWSEVAGRMQRSDSGCFSIELVITPGRHRYQWMIDGALVRPDGAPAYAPDSFGGEDAVLIVPP